MLGSASADVLFSEDFESVSISGDSPISLFGWVNDIQANDNRVYNENAVWSWTSASYTEAFYTTEGMGAGFTSFDLSSAPGLKFSVENKSTYNPGTTLGYFALQLDGGTNWFVSANPVPVPTGVWTSHELEFDPLASEWYMLTVSGTGTVGVAGASIGANPLSDLAGTVTGVGFVIVHSGTGTQDFDNYSVYTPTVTTPPAAPNLQKVWMNGTTAKLYWQTSLTATNYIVKTASTSGGPYTPVGYTTTNSFWVSNLVAGTTNYFVVAAENEAGEGDPSTEVSGVAQSYTIFADSDISWGDWLFSYKEAAFDGDTATFYESPNPTDAYVGADFGAGNEIMPVELLYHPTIGKDGALVLLDGAEFQGSNDTNTWDTLATITSQPTVEWHSVYTDTTNAYRFIRLLFVNGNDSIHGTIGEIAFGTNVPPFKEITVSPVDGAAIPGPTSIALTAKIVEWDSEFDSGELYLNGLLVASSGTPSPDGTNVLSYAAGELAVGSYTGKVVVTGVNPVAALTNEWTFEIIPIPSSTALKLWNINMGGNEFASQTVADGTVIRAPSTGLNGWNNLISPYDSGAGGDSNEVTWLPTNALSIVDANGANPIDLIWTGSDHDWNIESSPVDELFIGYFGSQGFDSTMEISGLDPDSKYDIYVYFTWGWSANAWVYYTITEGSGEITSLTLKPNNDNVTSGSYSNIVRRENYVVFTQISPSLAGNIHINATSDDGGWSGLQIAEVSGTGPTVNPAIQSIDVAGGSVSLQWASETGVNYSILRKLSLTDANWNTVKSGISGGDPSTSDSVPASGADEEFYIIEGQ